MNSEHEFGTQFDQGRPGDLGDPGDRVAWAKVTNIKTVDLLSDRNGMPSYIDFINILIHEWFFSSSSFFSLFGRLWHVQMSDRIPFSDWILYFGNITLRNYDPFPLKLIYYLFMSDFSLANCFHTIVHFEVNFWTHLENFKISKNISLFQTGLKVWNYLNFSVSLKG